MQHIGIVACSAEGAALCYRTICQLGRQHHPEVSVHTPPLAAYVAAIERDDWSAVGDLMLASATKLAAIGADFLICPDNTIHRAFGHVAPRSPRPWLHIAEVVAAEARARGIRRAGILGTRWLVDSEVYPAAFAAHGIATTAPSIEDRDEVSRIIMDELVPGIARDASTQRLRDVIRRLANTGCDGVILGCTELPLVLGEHEGIPTLDSTRLLAKAAVARAVSDRPTS